MFRLTRPTAMIAHRRRRQPCRLCRPPNHRSSCCRRAVHLGARDDRHFLPFDQPDAAAEVRQDVFAQPETEPEDIVSLEEERALGKEEWKPREVRAPRVDFGFRKVRVDSRDETTFAPSRCVTSRLG